MEEEQCEIGKIKNRIDNIIINGLLVASNDYSTEIDKLYSTVQLEYLVGTFLKEYLFEGFGPDIKQWFDSDEGNTNMCTKVIPVGDSVYICQDCQFKEKSIICYNCFLHSEHVNHEYAVLKSTYDERICHCGDEYAWKAHSSCSKHIKSDRSKIVLSANFLNKFSNIMQYLCELIGKICTDDFSIFDNHIEEILNNYLRVNGMRTTPNIYRNRVKRYPNFVIDGNARKSCLLLIEGGTHSSNKYVDCLMTSLKISYRDSNNLAGDINQYGYSCVQYISDLDECKNSKESIEKSWRYVSNDRTVSFRIAKVYRLYFMRLTPILIDVINEFCFRKIQLCYVLSEIVFNRTSLAYTFVLNEHVLWKEMKNKMICQVLVVARYSLTGRLYAATLFLNNINHLYTRFMMDQSKETCSYLNLMIQIIHMKSVVVYLVENGFLCKMIHIFSHLLKDLGIKAGVDVAQLYKKAKTKQRDLDRVLHVKALLCSCLQVSLKEIDVSSKFKSELSEAGNKLVEFCFDFDDIQPIHIKRAEKIFKYESDYLILLYRALFRVFSKVIKWLIRYDEMAIKTLESFLERFSIDIQQISEATSRYIIDIKVMCCNIQTEKFSIFNLSHRVFVDIFMDCCVKGTLPYKIKDQVLDDEKMLMWIGLPAITALSFIANLLSSKPRKDPLVLDDLIYLYMRSDLRHYLYLQDFNALQILISHLDPDILLKYMLFNMVPSIQNQVNYSEPLSSILRLEVFGTGFYLHFLLVLVYNAMIEQHFVGVSDNPEYQLLERQIIHALACGYQTIGDIKDHIFVCHEVLFTDLFCSHFKDTFNNILEKVSFVVDSPDLENKISLKPEYFNFVNIYYYHLQFLRGCSCTGETWVPLQKK
ncbi:E3 ubiquitin-protein ligase UBR2 [Thelohanellus kitauei]|uniref:E3 ubiquitin-protein ligase n=1 Tax=Thelohanellus kitauei TaxID=669202 RepID=A0A0C2M9S2_THEKT|nr:E3 ubiquitin-protein ligase UBR2 [Thelohanellus kitauei]